MHESDGPQPSSLAFARSKQTNAPSIVPDSDRAEIVMGSDKAIGQHQADLTSGGDSTTVISTSKQIPHRCDSSKLNFSSRINIPSASRLFISQYFSGTDSEHLVLLGGRHYFVVLVLAALKVYRPSPRCITLTLFFIGND